MVSIPCSLPEREKEKNLTDIPVSSQKCKQLKNILRQQRLTNQAIAFTMLKDGIPIVYQGQEHQFSGAGAPLNREALWHSGYSTSSELYQWISRLNRIRSWALSSDAGYATYRAWSIYSDSRTIVMRKGNTGRQTIGLFTNVGESSTGIPITLDSSVTGFAPSQQVVDILSCMVLSTNAAGDIAVMLTGGIPRVLYPLTGLNGSGICPDITGPVTTTSASPISTTTSTLTAATSTTASATATATTGR